MPTHNNCETVPVEPRRSLRSNNQTKRTKIALFGIFGVQNLGNECVLQAMIHNIRERVPEAELYGIC